MLDVLKLMQDKVFAIGGRGPVRFDCWGFCLLGYAEYGKYLPDNFPAVGTPVERDAAIREAIADEARFKRLDQPEVPCLVALMIHPPLVSHVGMMISQVDAMHIMEKVGVVVTNLCMPLWKKRVAGFYRYIGEEK